jgi:hypothetical protein
MNNKLYQKYQRNGTFAIYACVAALGTALVSALEGQFTPILIGLCTSVFAHQYWFYCRLQQNELVSNDVAIGAK